MATLWCSTCKRFHEPQSSALCDREARRDRRSGRSAPNTAGAIVGTSLSVAALVGFVAGQLSNDAAVAGGACAVTALTLVALRWRGRARSSGTPSL